MKCPTCQAEMKAHSIYSPWWCPCCGTWGEEDVAGYLCLVHVPAQAKSHPLLTAERDKLRAFKDWVHQYLDTRGVPHHPPGPHGAEGCRIGDRLDWLMASHAALREALRVAVEELHSYRADCADYEAPDNVGALDLAIVNAAAALDAAPG